MTVLTQSLERIDVIVGWLLFSFVLVLLSGNGLILFLRLNKLAEVFLGWLLGGRMMGPKEGLRVGARRIDVARRIRVLLVIVIPIEIFNQFADDFAYALLEEIFIFYFSVMVLLPISGEDTFVFVPVFGPFTDLLYHGVVDS